MRSTSWGNQQMRSQFCARAPIESKCLITKNTSEILIRIFGIPETSCPLTLAAAQIAARKASRLRGLLADDASAIRNQSTWTDNALYVEVPLRGSNLFDEPTCARLIR